MTLPDRTPLGADDMAKLHPSTWQQECKALRARVAKLEAALRVIESHRRKCHKYDKDAGYDLRDFDVEDVMLMEWQARAALGDTQ